MKIKKLLTPILSAVGTAAAIVPVVCLTSCSGDAETKSFYALTNGAKEAELYSAPTGTKQYEFTLLSGAVSPDSVEANVVMKKTNENINIVQCTSSRIGDDKIIVYVDYWCQRGVSETQETTFDIKLICKVGTGKDQKTYQQIESGFKYTITANN